LAQSEFPAAFHLLRRRVIRSLQSSNFVYIFGMSFEGETASSLPVGRKLPNPAICRAKPANWPGTAFCLVHEPDECTHARYFNEVAYCTHFKRADIAARTMTFEVDLSGDSH
jgi:hypothetical protein